MTDLVDMRGLLAQGRRTMSAPRLYKGQNYSKYNLTQIASHASIPLEAKLASTQRILLMWMSYNCSSFVPCGCIWAVWEGALPEECFLQVLCMSVLQIKATPEVNRGHNTWDGISMEFPREWDDLEDNVTDNLLQVPWHWDAEFCKDMSQLLSPQYVWAGRLVYTTWPNICWHLFSG